MLHIVNGDATLALLQQARVPGEFLVWRDALLDGPAPNGLASRADWEERAARNATDWGISRDAYLQGALSFFARLDAGDPEEVVLWFEEDLFCQLPLCHLMPRAKKCAPEWSVICPERPLGTHSPDELRIHFAARRRPPPAREALAERAWAAYSASDPRGLEALVQEDLAAWPLLKRGLLAHLARFPSTVNGLGALEAAAMAALREGPLAFPALFKRLQPTPLFRTYGIGDAQVASLVDGLSSSPSPLLALTSPARRDDVLERVMTSTVTLTRVGEAVLNGSRDHTQLNPPDRWLGGVHLAPGKPLWRWDGAKLVAMPPP